MPGKELHKLNPQIATITIGVRKLKEIHVYPLSVGDEMKLSSILSSSLADFVKEKGENAEFKNNELIEFVLNFLRNNIDKVAAMITDEGADIINDLTNIQLVALVELVYAMNFEAVSKKVLGLFEKMSSTSALGRPLQQSASSTTTDLNTSSTDLSKMEELPADK